jgi:hypothetical protein
VMIANHCPGYTVEDLIMKVPAIKVDALMEAVVEMGDIINN